MIITVILVAAGSLSALGPELPILRRGCCRLLAQLSSFCLARLGTFAKKTARKSRMHRTFQLKSAQISWIKNYLNLKLYACPQKEPEDSKDSCQICISTNPPSCRETKPLTEGELEVFIQRLQETG